MAVRDILCSPLYHLKALRRGEHRPAFRYRKHIQMIALRCRIFYKMPVSEGKRIAVAHHGSAHPFVSRQRAEIILQSVSSVLHEKGIRCTDDSVESHRAEHLHVIRPGTQEQPVLPAGMSFTYESRQHGCHHSLSFSVRCDGELLDSMSCQCAAAGKNASFVSSQSYCIRVSFIPETA